MVFTFIFSLSLQLAFSLMCKMLRRHKNGIHFFMKVGLTRAKCVCLRRLNLITLKTVIKHFMPWNYNNNYLYIIRLSKNSNSLNLHMVSVGERTSHPPLPPQKQNETKQKPGACADCARLTSGLHGQWWVGGDAQPLSHHAIAHRLNWTYRTMSSLLLLSIK